MLLRALGLAFVVLPAACSSTSTNSGTGGASSTGGASTDGASGGGTAGGGGVLTGGTNSGGTGGVPTGGTSGGGTPGGGGTPSGGAGGAAGSGAGGCTGVCVPGVQESCNCNTGTRSCTPNCTWGPCNSGGPDLQSDKANCGQCDYCCAKPGGAGVTTSCPGSGDAYNCVCGTCYYIPPGNCGTECTDVKCSADACRKTACATSCPGTCP